MDQYHLWLRLLCSVRPTYENDELLTTYFLSVFGSHPEDLEQFLASLHDVLRSSKIHEENVTTAVQYLRILSPLCDRFGLFEQKSLLDTLCFRISDPDGYSHIEQSFRLYKKKSSLIVRRITKQLSLLLESSGIPCDIGGRYKHLYSIAKKMKVKHYRSLLSLQDIFAFRIIVEEHDPRICFDLLNLLHDTYTPIADRFKDYISIPKVNGYQSIHTVLTGVTPDLTFPIEVQIRTRAMHEFSEHGLASHWLYARAKKTTLPQARERKLLEHYRFLSDELLQEDQQVFCITPKGDLLPLQAGATARDFADRIHTELGCTMTAAMVNERIVEPDHLLAHGDCVRIITASSNRVHAS